MDVAIVSYDQSKQFKTILKEKSFYDGRWLTKNLTKNRIALPINKSFLDFYLSDGFASSPELNRFQFDIDKLELQPNTKKDSNNPILKLKNKLNDLQIWSEELEHDLPKSYEKFEDILLLNNNSFKMGIWQSKGLWDLVASSFNCKRIARKGAISKDIFRRPGLSMILGDSRYVEHQDNGIKYSYDITKCMFSPGNITEKLRISKFDCSSETVVDLYAGIGYFTLPYLVHAKAMKVIACEWNPDAAAALRNNLKLNKVLERCQVLEGDNRLTCPHNVADRINLGLIPSSEEGWETACIALRKDVGGVMHVHGNVTSKRQEKDSTTKCEDGHNGEETNRNKTKHIYAKTTERPEWNNWASSTSSRLKEILEGIDAQKWNVLVIHVEHVKSYAPHIDHVVADIDCRPYNELSN